MRIEYRRLEKEEICRELFGQFIRRQEVTKCWRREGGKWVIQDAPFIDDWSEEDYQLLVSCLKNTAETGGAVWGGAGRDSRLWGRFERYRDAVRLRDGRGGRERAAGGEGRGGGGLREQ